MITADNLRKIRLVYRLSQAEFGALAGVSASYINQVERGKCCLSDRVRRALTDELEMTPDKLAQILRLYDEMNNGTKRLEADGRYLRRLCIAV